MIHSRHDIIKSIQNEADQVVSSILAANENLLFAKKHDKWNIANNVEHLCLSARPVTLAFMLPKLVVRVFGKPNRPECTYDMVITKYLDKLAQGGKASAPFIPKQKFKTKAELIRKFKHSHDRLIQKIMTWRDEDLSSYLLPHPLLGKLTMREMIFFTIYHIQHHHNAIKKLV